MEIGNKIKSLVSESQKLWKDVKLQLAFYFVQVGSFISLLANPSDGLVLVSKLVFTVATILLGVTIFVARIKCKKISKELGSLGD